MLKNTLNLYTLPRDLFRQIMLIPRYRKITKLLKQLQPNHVGHELIRFGPRGDGGYLVPNDLSGIIACFSPGVCGTSGFELDCANAGQQVFLADASVDGPAEHHTAFVFTKKYLGRENLDNFITIADWVKSSISTQEGDLILQMDIEGAEYGVIESMTPDLLKRFRILVIEFHGLHRILSGSELFWNQFRANVEKILRYHACVHIHPNNTSPIRKFGSLEIPDLLEITFLRRDRVHSLSPVQNFPNPLDCDCDPNLPHISLPKCWWP